jgi:hypothetical protein
MRDWGSGPRLKVADLLANLGDGGWVETGWRVAHVPNVASRQVTIQGEREQVAITPSNVRS